MTRTDKTHATYEFSGTPEALRAARKDKDKYIHAACDIHGTGAYDRTIKDIRNVSPGTLELRDGQWVITRKAKVELIFDDNHK